MRQCHCPALPMAGAACWVEQQPCFAADPALSTGNPFPKRLLRPRIPALPDEPQGAYTAAALPRQVCALQEPGCFSYPLAATAKRRLKCLFVVLFAV